LKTERQDKEGSIKSLAEVEVCFHCRGSTHHCIDHLIDVGVDAFNPVQVILPFASPDAVAGETTYKPPHQISTPGR
jgi:hypothetical protein